MSSFFCKYKSQDAFMSYRHRCIIYSNGWVSDVQIRVMINTIIALLYLILTVILPRQYTPAPQNTQMTSKIVKCRRGIMCTNFSAMMQTCVFFWRMSCVMYAAFSSICPSPHSVILSAGFLIGGDVLRLLHGHMDECLMVPSGEQGEEQRR